MLENVEINVVPTNRDLEILVLYIANHKLLKYDKNISL